MVIGNSGYEGALFLRNPVNDANAMEAALKELGFSVSKKKDLSLTQMEEALVEFRRKLTKGGLGLFYYAGHGVQVRGENYLVPLGTRLREEYEVKRQCLEVSQVLDAMAESEASLKVLVLDCCRNNPLKRGWSRSSSGQGLAGISTVPEGTLIAFSTSPNLTAADGEGENSPYAEHLVAALRSRPAGGLELGAVFREASRAVKKQTGQVPWLNQEASLEEYFLWRQGSASPVPMPMPPSTPAPMSTPPSTPAPREVTAEFTVRREEKGPPLEGAQVELIYTGAEGASPLTLGRTETDAEGACKITTTLSVSQQKKGSFDVVARHDGMSKDWALPDFPRELRYSLWIPGRPTRPSEGGGQSFANSIGMKLVLVPAGEFMMGSEDGESGESEKPAHRVRITKAFYLGVTEVTQGQYEQVMGTNPSGFTHDAQRPVEFVSWDDAVEFCRKLSQKEGREYRLPTEAQWEYACRAGSSAKWCFGDDESSLGEYAWYQTNSDRTTHPVGQKLANAWGLYDMHGNVWEWCRDWYGEYSAGAVSDPTGPPSRSHRVARGGCRYSYAKFCRSAYRGDYEPDYRHSDLGFRVSLVPAD